MHAAVQASVREIGLVEIAPGLGEASEGAESDESSGHELDRSRDGGALGGGSGGAPGGGRDGGGATGGSEVDCVLNLALDYALSL